MLPRRFRPAWKHTQITWPYQNQSPFIIAEYHHWTRLLFHFVLRGEIAHSSSYGSVRDITNREWGITALGICIDEL